jgi:hypothetical protein
MIPESNLPKELSPLLKNVLKLSMKIEKFEKPPWDKLKVRKDSFSEVPKKGYRVYLLRSFKCSSFCPR